MLTTGAARAPIEFNLSRRFSESLMVGVEYMPRDNRISPTWNYRLIERTDSRPAVAVGQGTAWPSGKVTGSAYSLTVADSIGAGISAYISASYAPDQSLWQIPAGLNWRFDEDWSTRLMWDGENLHPFLSYSLPDWDLGLLLLDQRYPTLAASFSF